MTTQLTLTPVSSIPFTPPYSLANISIYNVKDYAAKGDGLTNDAVAIQAADTAAAAANGVVLFPAGSYLIRAGISQSAPWYGAPGSVTIVIDSTFVAGVSGVSSLGAIWNADYDTAFNATTANRIEHHGINVHHTNGATGVPSTFWFGNTSLILFDDCYLLTDGASITTPLQCYAANQRVIIQSNTRIVNATGQTTGLTVQIKNSCGAAGATSRTEQVSIDASCYLEGNCSDEVLAIYAEDGYVGNVHVSCKIAHVAGGSTAGRVVDFFGSVAAPTAYTLLENVTFDGEVVVDDFTVDIVGVGLAGDTSTLRNIKISPHITCAVSASGTTAAINHQSAVSNCVVSGATIINTGTVALTYGIRSFGLVTNNMITGKFSQGISGCSSARDNNISLTSGGIGVYDCGSSSGNVISGVATGVLCDTTDHYQIYGNRITLGVSAGVGCVTWQAPGGAAPSVTVTGNTLETTAGGQTAITGAGTAAPRIGLNTWINGGGTYSSLATANAWTVADG